jgi:hypothetical protein
MSVNGTRCHFSVKLIHEKCAARRTPPVALACHVLVSILPIETIHALIDSDVRG